jgi:hypothetical protein
VALKRLSRRKKETRPIGAFDADDGLHSLVVSPQVGAIQNQHTRKSSPPAKNMKTPRNKKDQGEDVEKTGERVGYACI